jgi:hypothetical protein
VRVSRDRALLPVWLWLALWLGVELAGSLRVSAQTVRGAARVNTQVDPCVPIDVDHFHRVLAIELGTSIEYAPSAARQPDGTVIRIVCTDAAAVQLQLDDNLTRKSMQRIVDLPAVDVATRTRLLALSVAEFVVASWVELQLARPPLAAAGPDVSDAATEQASQLARERLPGAQLPVTPPPEEAPSIGSRWLLGVSFEPVLFSGGSGLLPQLSLHLEQRPSAHFVMSLAVSIGRGSWDVYWASAVAGEARITTSSGRLAFGYVTAFDWFELAITAGARGGVVYMAGDTERTGRYDLLADELYAPWGGPLALLTAAALIGPLRVALELEGGYVTLPAEAVIRPAGPCIAACTGTVVAELSGFWGAAGLGLGWLF